MGPCGSHRRAWRPSEWVMIIMIKQERHLMRFGWVRIITTKLEGHFMCFGWVVITIPGMGCCQLPVLPVGRAGAAAGCVPAVWSPVATQWPTLPSTLIPTCWHWHQWTSSSQWTWGSYWGNPGPAASPRCPTCQGACTTLSVQVSWGR